MSGIDLRRYLENRDDRQWLLDAALTIASLLVLCAIYAHEAAGAYRVWVDSPTFNHCFLILPISIFMMWSRRDGLSAIPHKPNFLAALLILPAAFVWFLSFVSGILEAQQFAVITIFQVMMLSVLGWPAYRKLIAPLLFLYFLIPSGAELVPMLQQVTAHFAVFLLKSIGIPVYSNGAVIDIPAGTFVVAEACAGLRFLVATVAFGVFYATEIYRSLRRRLIFIMLAVIVPIVANGLRVFGLIAAAEWLGNATAAMADHLLYGWIFFSLVLVILIILGRSFSDRDDELPAQKAATPAPPQQPFQTFMAAAFCAIIATILPVFTVAAPNAHGASMPSVAPRVSKPWHEVSDSVIWSPVVTGPSRSFSGAYSNGHDTVFAFVALYPSNVPNNLIRSENRIANEKYWKLNESNRTTLPIAGHPESVSLTTVSGGSRRLTIWSFYVVDGNVDASALGVKLQQLRDYFSSGKCLSGFVAIAIPDIADPRFARQVAINYLASLQPMNSYLCRRSP